MNENTQAQIGGGIVGSMFGMINNLMQNTMAARQTDRDRQQNYMYGEMAANAADARTRRLYNDFYSPEALMRQYQEAGLSPSMMFGGTPGQGGQGGAQGNGASGLQTMYTPYNMLEGAQIANIMAQTSKIKAETKNINKDTVLKALDEDYNMYRNYLQKIELEILDYEPVNAEGQTTSFFDLANESKNYEEFIEKVKYSLDQTGSEEKKTLINTEYGRKQLNKIYMSSNMFERDIAILSADGVSAKFQMSIINAMTKEGFAQQNAETAVKTLKAAAETAELTSQEKEAWNNLLNRIGKKSETAKDVLIILSMLINNAATNWHMPNMSTHNTNNTTNVFNKK